MIYKNKKINIELYNDDCINVLKKIKNKTIDLILIDPPYFYKIKKLKDKNFFQNLKKNNLIGGFNFQIIEECVRVLKNINIYIWCSKLQVFKYLEYFTNNFNCEYEILIWNKPNCIPLFNNHYLSDKEICLYFYELKKNIIKIENFSEAKTVYSLPVNKFDLKKYKHPTIKPLTIISNFIKNSSKENDTVLDCFMGSGTTGVACKNLKRNFIGVEIEKKFFDIANFRINNEISFIENL